MTEFSLIGWGADVFAEELLFFAFLLFALQLMRVLYTGTKLAQHVPESAALIFLGLIAGLLAEFVHFGHEQRIKELLGVSPEVYLLVFIPIIIFDATYFLDRGAFWRNFGEIVIYAVIGTVINATLISAGIIAFGKFFIHKYEPARVLSYSSLLSAVDPVAVIAIMEQQHVNTNLFSLAFGEATLNDGVAIAVFSTVKGIDALIAAGDSAATIVGLGIAKFAISVLGALAIGSAVTVLFSLLTRISYKNKYTEVFIMLACPMTAYILADALLFSGVIAVMSTALLMTRYCDYNCAQESLAAFKNFVHALSQAFEAFLFFTMGTQVVFTICDEKVRVDWLFTGVTPLICFIARAIGVVVQTFFINMRRKKLNLHISIQEQIILMWCGLRGGIAFSLAKIYSEELAEDGSTQDYVQGQMFLFATSVLIVLTIFGFGLTMRGMIKCLHIRKQKELPLGFHSFDKVIEVVVSGFGVVTGQTRWFGRFLHIIDHFVQRICLKKPLPMEREFLDIAEELRKQKIKRQKDGSEGDLATDARTRALHENRVQWSRAVRNRRAAQAGTNDAGNAGDVSVALLDAKTAYQ